MILVRPNLQTAVVSSVSYGGIPVGNDTTGTGSAAAPFLTLDQAQKSMASTAQISLNGNPASPPTYIPTRTLATALTLKGTATGSAVLAASNANSILTVDPVAGQAVTVQDLILDADLGTPALRCIDVASESTAYTLNLTRCTLKNFDTYGLKNLSANFKGTLNIDSLTVTAGTAWSAVNVDSVAASSTLNVTGTNSVTITNQQASDIGSVINWTANGAGVGWNMTGTFGFTVTVDAALATVRQHYGFLGTGALCQWEFAGTQQMTHVGVRQCYVVGFTRNAYPISNSYIKGGLSVVYDCVNAGISIFTSNDSVWGTKTGADNLVIQNFTITDLTGASHGAFHCWSTNSKILDGVITGPALGVVDKENDGCETARIAVSSCGSAHILDKGSINSSIHDNAITTTVGKNGDGIRCEVNTDTGTFATATVSDNDLTVNGSTSSLLANVPAGNTATFAGNDWHYTSGTLPSTKWQYGATAYTLFSTWHAGPGPTDTSNIS